MEMLDVTWSVAGCAVHSQRDARHTSQRMAAWYGRYSRRTQLQRSLGAVPSMASQAIARPEVMRTTSCLSGQ